MQDFGKYMPTQYEPRRMRLTAGGNRLEYDGKMVQKRQD